MPPAEGLKN